MTRPVSGRRSAGTRTERRLVTLLFLDLSGYTELCHSRDPEEVHLLIRPLMHALRDVCLAAGATVPSIEGDGFMAVFGAPVAHEDDPLRAVGTAVRLQQLVTERRDRLPDLPRLHLGLHVGEVVTAPSWEDDGLSVSGDAVNVASRLCGVAEADEVVVSEDLVGLAPASCAWSDLREVALRGRAGLVPVRSLLWQQDAGPSPLRPRWSSESGYVPRPRLEARLRELLAEGHAAVVGAAGTGKSRLVSAVLEPASTATVATDTITGSSLRDLVAGLLEQRAPHAGALLARLRGTVPVEAGQDVDQELVRAAVDCLAAGGVRTLVLEDAERLPESDLALLTAVLADAPVTWLLVARESCPVPGLPVLDVPGLEDAEVRALLDELLPGASEEVRAVVVARAGDSPLFLEQCARLLVESGAVLTGDDGSLLVAPELLREVPTQMRLFVSSRIDLLPTAEREALHVAAVLGDEPDPGLLAFLLRDAAEQVDALVARGLLLWRRGPADTRRLRFAHALVRDVAYAGQLRSERAAVHRAAAEWYSVLPVAQVLEAQAYHLESAVALGNADCDLVRRTVDAMVLHARSIVEERTRTAAEVLARARALRDSRPECGGDLLPLLLAQGRVLGLQGSDADSRAVAQQALELARQSGDAGAEGEALLLLARVTSVEDPNGATVLDAAQAAFRALGDVGSEAKVEVERGRLAHLQGGTPLWLQHMERAYQLAVRAGDTRLQAGLAQDIAVFHALATGRTDFERWGAVARAVAREDDAALETRLDLGGAILADQGLDPVAGLPLALRCATSARELGLGTYRLNAEMARARLLLLDGRLVQARQALLSLRELAERRPASHWRLQVDLVEARLRSREGDVAGAEQVLAVVAAHPRLEELVLRRDLAETRAWVALERGHFAQAQAQAQDAVLLDLQAAERCSVLRPRLVAAVAGIASRGQVPLADLSALRSEAQASGLVMVREIVSRFHVVDELVRGWDVDLHALTPELATVEARALDREIAAVMHRDWDGLLEAAATWATLGTTVWQARALLWHAELTGAEHPEADALLARLQAPPGLAETFRAQVRDLRG
ncbi:MAG: adenylate/guanylate cyclase domain-containing protein [Actinomycetes bacterium]